MTTLLLIIDVAPHDWKYYNIVWPGQKGRRVVQLEHSLEGLKQAEIITKRSIYRRAFLAKCEIEFKTAEEMLRFAEELLISNKALPFIKRG